MIASSLLRTLLGAALCCAPLLVAWASHAAEIPTGEGSSLGAGARDDEPAAATWAMPCYLTYLQGTPNLLASAANPANPAPAAASSSTPASSARAPPKTLQVPKRPPAFHIEGPIIFSSQGLTSDSNGIVTLSDNVEAHMGDRQIQAEQMTYDRVTNEISVSGKVRYADPQVRVQGDSGHYGDEGALFTHAQFQLLKLPGHGSANEISMTSANVWTLRRVFYTSCPPPRANWDIRARELTLDTDASRGVAHGARVDFQGVPILYVPYLSFPLSTARQSGFLFPQLGSSSRDGIILGIPWYWNIAPNQDATFTPTEYTTRGLNMGVEYRFLSASNSGTFDGDYLPHDSSYDAERNYARLIDRLDLGSNTRVQTHLESVSDTEYFEDFTQGVQSTSTAFLQRSLAIEHRDDIWNLRLETLGFQTIDSTLPIYERPYVQTPRLSAAAAWSPPSWPALQLGFNSEMVNFSRAGCSFSASPSGALVPCCTPMAGTQSTCSSLASELMDFPDGVNVSGWRLDAEPNIGLDFSGPGYFFRPNATWEFTQYVLRDVNTDELAEAAMSGTTASGEGNSSNPQRNLPILSVDSGLTFERLSGASGIGSVTLEPRLMYTYIPYRNQDDLPLFDTSAPNPNMIELFRANRYVGLDRIGDENAFTLGVTTEMFASGSGARYLSASIGQSVYLQPPRVTLPGETVNAHTSDLIGEINLTAYRNWNLLLDAAANDAVSRIEQTEIELQYRADGQQVVNINYQYNYGQYQQIDTSAAWPILAHWDLYARAVYSLLDHASIEDFAGFQYRGSCWGVRAVWQRSVTLRNGERDSGFSLQVELTGLSNVGSQVTTFLEQSIRGYSPSTGKPNMPLRNPEPTTP